MENQKKQKKKDRVLLVSSLISVGILLVILAVAFLFPILEAKMRLSRTEKAFEQFSDADALVISDPLFGVEGRAEPAEAVLGYEEGADICGRVAAILDSAKYSETEKTLLGSWAMSVSARGEDGAFTVYLTEDGFYLSKDEKQYHFTLSQERLGAYETLLDDLEDILAKSIEK